MISREQERIIRGAVDGYLRREFTQFNAHVEPPRVRVAELVRDVASGRTHHAQTRTLEAIAEEFKVPYDPARPVLALRDLTKTDTNLISAAEVAVTPRDILRPYSVAARLDCEIKTGLVGDTVVAFTSATSTPGTAGGRVGRTWTGTAPPTPRRMSLAGRCTSRASPNSSP